MGNNLPPRFKFKDTYDSIEVPTTHHQHLPSKATLEAKFDELIAEEEVVAPTTHIKADMAVSSNLEVGTSNLFVDTETGNVGIGTNSPGFSLDVHGTANVGTLTATSVSGPLSGNASTATKLATARAINGVDFDGSAAITVNGTNYDVNDSWLKENGDNAHFKQYGNSRQMVFRTDGITEYATDVGGYPFAWMYGGDASSNRLMLLNTSGQLWCSDYGWLHDKFMARTQVFSDTDANDNFTGQTIDYNASGSQTNTTHRIHRALLIDVDSSATGGDTNNEHRLYGIYNDVRHTGDSDLVYGLYSYTRSDHASGTTTNLRAGDFYAIASGTGTNTNIYGINSFAYKDAGSTGTTANMYGVRGEVQLNGGECTNAYVFQSQIDHNAGTMDTAYLYYGSYSGTVGTKYGVYVTGETKNYFSGNVGIGTTNPGYKLDVDGDINVTGTGSTFRINGTALANSATIAASASAGNSTIVQRHSAGYIFANYFNTTPNDVASGVTKVCVETGNDGYIRHGTSAAISTFLGLANSATIEATTADTANKIAQRNGSGDIFARLFRSDYQNQSTISGGIAYRVNTSDNYIRFCTDMGAVRSHIGAYGSGSNITRTAHSNGYMIGSYNSVGANSTKTNPIYTIGSNYQPSDTSLGDMYGIGYSHGNFTSILTGGWGMYVAADGDARIGFNGSSGHIKCTGYVDAGTEVYCQNWIRTRGNSGHYWESSSNGHGWHIYPKTRADMYFRTGSGSGGIAGTISNTTVRGYVHWNTSNQIGFLNKDRAWALRMTSDKNCSIMGGLELGTDGKDWGSMTASYNGNIRKNFWIQSTYGGNTSSNYGWWIGTQNQTLSSSDNDLHFICLRNGSATHNGYIQDGSYNVHMNFTGQHRTFVKDTPIQQLQDKEGLIVSADQDEYIRMSGGIAHGSDAITINESLPVVSLSTKSNDKKCFGVLSTTEDPEGRREVHGNFVSNFTKEKGDTRIYVNSVGEGAVWVTNINGNLESGDYITTSNVVGYGMKQDDDILHNYTVAKITMNCDFNPKTIPKKNIKKKLANVDYWVEYATIEITVEEYEALPENERKRGDEDNEDEDKYYKIYKKEIQIADPGDDKHVHEVHEEFVNVLDEHGQLQWEDHPTETEKAYKIRYLTSDGQITDEANAVHIAAFVGCTYHCG